MSLIRGDKKDGGEQVNPIEDNFDYKDIKDDYFGDLVDTGFVIQVALNSKRMTMTAQLWNDAVVQMTCLMNKKVNHLEVSQICRIFATK